MKFEIFDQSDFAHEGQSKIRKLDPNDLILDVPSI